MITGNKESQRLEIWYFYPGYGDESTDKRIQKILEEIKTKHCIHFRILKADNRDIQEEYYKKYFSQAKQAWLLRQRTGQSTEKDLKSRNGKGKPMLRGLIALVENNQVQYYVKRGGSGKDALRFLQDFLKDPQATKEECYAKADELTNEEEALLDAFKAKGIIKGNYQPIFPVGRFFKDNFGCNLRFVDAICVEKSGTIWVLEVERELNYTAIGQAISYKYLYEKDNPGVKTRPSIICSTATQDLKKVCENSQISVFVVKEV